MSTNIKMKGYKVSELNFVNSLENGAQVKFSNKYTYNVKYSNTNVCIGQLTAEMFDKEKPEKFGIKIVVEALFEYNTELEKEKIHVETFKSVFPFARSIVSSVSVNAGVPQIILPDFDIEGQSIYRFEKNF